MTRQPSDFVSRRMRRVKAKNSAIELALRREVFRLGLRYRLHVRALPGCPDLCFPAARVCVFVDSDFWHGYDWARRQVEIRVNRPYWIAKIEATRRRDRRVTGLLRRQGWEVRRYWGHEVRENPRSCAEEIAQLVRAQHGLRSTAARATSKSPRAPRTR